MLDHDNLEDFADAASYDEDSDDIGIAFYTALAQETGGPVLEIASGTGRVSIPIAQRGFAVTGMDIVPGMVAQARSKSAGLPTRWVVGDGRTFDLGEQFRLIFLTGNAFQMFLTRADQEGLLERVRAHLADDGLFAFETRNPRWSTYGHPAADYDGLFTNLETRLEEKVWPPYTDRFSHEVHVSRTLARGRAGAHRDDAHRVTLHVPAGACGAAALQWLHHHPSVWRLESGAADLREHEHHLGLPQAIM